jgi:hypothetical protein
LTVKKWGILRILNSDGLIILVEMGVDPKKVSKTEMIIGVENYYLFKIQELRDTTSN